MHAWPMWWLVAGSWSHMVAADKEIQNWVRSKLTNKIKQTDWRSHEVRHHGWTTRPPFCRADPVSMSLADGCHTPYGQGLVRIQFFRAASGGRGPFQGVQGVRREQGGAAHRCTPQGERWLLLLLLLRLCMYLRMYL